MQKQLASFLATRGTTVLVENAATMAPPPTPSAQEAADKVNKRKAKIKKGGG